MVKMILGGGGTARNFGWSMIQGTELVLGTFLSMFSVFDYPLSLIMPFLFLIVVYL
jgi:hypothetical protein